MLVIYNALSPRLDLEIARFVGSIVEGQRVGGFAFGDGFFHDCCDVNALATWALVKHLGAGRSEREGRKYAKGDPRGCGRRMGRDMKGETYDQRYKSRGAR